jgi:hypothetical protein
MSNQSLIDKIANYLFILVVCMIFSITTVILINIITMWFGISDSFYSGWGGGSVFMVVYATMSGWIKYE